MGNKPNKVYNYILLYVNYTPFKIHYKALRNLQEKKET